MASSNLDIIKKKGGNAKSGQQGAHPKPFHIMAVYHDDDQKMSRYATKRIDMHDDSQKETGTQEVP